MRKSFLHATAVLCLALFGLAVSVPAWAQTGQTVKTGPEDGRIPIITEVPIPVPDAGLTPGSAPERVAQYLTSGRVEDVAQYIGIIYNFLISIVGFVASIAMIIGGFQYLTSAGDAGKIGAAKSKMANAFIGMILALGAYTILNTINPRLLQLQLPDVRAVKTELFTLPNCEDIKVPVTPYGGTDCGFAGKYMQGNSEQICIYAGACRLVPYGQSGNPKYGHRTCMQRMGLDSSKVQEELRKDPNARFADCIACGELTIAKARSLGFGEIQASCEAWQNAFDLLPDSIKTYTRKGTKQLSGQTLTVEKGMFYGCYPKVKRDGCTGIPIYCFDVTRDDDTTGGNEGRVATACEGYDESPDPTYGTDLDANGFATQMRVVDDCGGGVSSAGCAGLEGFPVHLATVCAQNPCQDYKDPEVGHTPFINGCKSGSGLFNRAQRVVRYGDLAGINDCSCIVDDNVNCSGR